MLYIYRIVSKCDPEYVFMLSYPFCVDYDLYYGVALFDFKLPEHLENKCGLIFDHAKEKNESSTN